MVDDSQDRIFEPTVKRRQAYKSSGKILQFNELYFALQWLCGGVSLAFISKNLYQTFAQIMHHYFIINKKDIQSDEYLLNLIYADISMIFKTLLPFIITIYTIAILKPILMGERVFSLKFAQPKLERINPLQGLKRIFSLNTLIELAKALIKMIIIGLIIAFFIYFHYQEFIQLQSYELFTALLQAQSLLSKNYLYIGLSLLVIAILDALYQFWKHNKQLKMTKYEMKQESKETEISPEIKKSFYNLQKRSSPNTLTQNLAAADVVIVDSEHYAVALRYRDMNSTTPIVLTKGENALAIKIIQLARRYGVAILSAPEFARATYFYSPEGAIINSKLCPAAEKIYTYIQKQKKANCELNKKFEELGDLPIPFELSDLNQTGLSLW